ncbi:lariat debranching enzyme [Condylostylus longicornis]|uniref:lariat debranching enzyme n=1 Tax=Condylostylus longicornis TaxID=2530218 RepID=UPI00244E5237|nr:lariat debranching enzyme [Condylostylus longicornis]
MKIAIEGCAHGELEKIYDTIAKIEEEENIKVDLLICCGDFQATRNLDDLQTMAVPKKFQDMCSFYKYYSGEKLAPILTIFIGGNHEASNYLQELPYGGWAAPNIYYMGLAGVININGIRIAGVSGIYKGHDYLKGHHEFSPYSDETKRSVYHVRQLEIFRLKQISGKIDICISHDWPKGVHNFGNQNQLLRFKPHFKDDIESNRLGSPPCGDLLNKLQPKYWFAGHLHCKFAALIQHEETDNITKFLALDKCLPKRRFLQIMDIERNTEDLKEKISISYDLEWLTILHLTNHLLYVKNSKHYLPGPTSNERFDFSPTEEEMEMILKKFNHNLEIPQNFCKTVEPYDPNDNNYGSQQPKAQINPQTTQFCELLGIDDPLSLAMLLSGHELSHSTILDESITSDLNNSSFIMDQSDHSEQNLSLESSPLKRKSMFLPNPKESEEIAISDNDEEESFTEESSEILNSFDSSKNVTTETFLDSSGFSDIDNKFEKTSNLEDLIEVQNSPELDIIVKENDTSKPPIKKFKRRNQDIYNKNSDEES